jgi:hypothetical protein
VCWANVLCVCSVSNVCVSVGVCVHVVRATKRQTSSRDDECATVLEGGVAVSVSSWKCEGRCDQCLKGAKVTFNKRKQVEFVQKYSKVETKMMNEQDHAGSAKIGG